MDGCEIRRRTRHPDGSLISGLIQASPGCRRVRDLWTGDGCGPFEKARIELIAVAREVDALLAMIGSARATIADAEARLPATVRLWQETLTEIATTDPRSMLVPLSPPSSNGTGEPAEEK